MPRNILREDWKPVRRFIAKAKGGNADAAIGAEPLVGHGRVTIPLPRAVRSILTSGPNLKIYDGDSNPDDPLNKGPRPPASHLAFKHETRDTLISHRRRRGPSAQSRGLHAERQELHAGRQRPGRDVRPGAQNMRMNDLLVSQSETPFSPCIRIIGHPMLGIHLRTLSRLRATLEPFAELCHAIGERLENASREEACKRLGESRTADDPSHSCSASVYTAASSCLKQMRKEKGG